VNRYDLNLSNYYPDAVYVYRVKSNYALCFIVLANYVLLKIFLVEKRRNLSSKKQRWGSRQKFIVVAVTTVCNKGKKMRHSLFLIKFRRIWKTIPDVFTVTANTSENRRSRSRAKLGLRFFLFEGNSSSSYLVNHILNFSVLCSYHEGI
jgi:hypothetical protein